MTNQEAIDELIIVRNVYDGMREAYKPCVEAIDVAISALQAQELSKNSAELEKKNGDLQPTCNQLATDTISRQDAIGEIRKCRFVVDAIEKIIGLPSAQLDLIAKIQNGIKVTDADDVYSCGMRNGMRWCKSLIDDEEPLYENCPSVQPKIVGCKDCIYWWESHKMCTRNKDKNHNCACMDCDADFYCKNAERRKE